MNWRKIKAEYIAGGISQRALAEKYGVSRTMVMRKANKEKWTEKRSAAETKAMERVEQKTAEEVADNAVLLQRIKNKLLRKLDQMVDQYPEAGVAELKIRGKNVEQVYRMKDIAAVYAALEDKTIKASVDIEDLSPLAELLKDDAE